MRRTLISSILAGAVLALVGCRVDKASQASSSMQSAVSPAVPASVARTADTRPLIVCFGDSLTAGLGADEGNTYPDFLQQDLDRAGYHYRVVNEGISGNTTKDGLDRLSDVVALHPEVVVLEFGGNDGLRGLKIENTRNNLDQMVSGLKASGTKVVIAGISLPPDYGADYVTKFTANYPTLGKKYNVPVLPFLLKDVYGVPGLMQADNTHATNKGNAIVARNLLPYVEPLLHK